MSICEFCRQYLPDGKCRLGLKLPSRMACREFDPGIEKFCSDPADFTGAQQIIQMASYFGMKGNELKKVKTLAAQEEQSRAATLRAQANCVGSLEQYEGEGAVKDSSYRESLKATHE